MTTTDATTATTTCRVFGTDIPATHTPVALTSDATTTCCGTSLPRPARKRAKKSMENSDRYAWIRRAIIRYGDAVAEGDPEDLAEMLALRADLDAAIGAAARGQRATWGTSWAAIGAVAGITRQAAQQKWGK